MENITANTATVDLNILQAVSIFASTEETRYYLNGVLVEIEPASVTYVATDGHRLFAYRGLQLDNPDNTLLGSFIIPTAECKPFKRGKHSDPKATLSTAGEKSLRFDYEGQGKIFKPIDGSFPNWRLVSSGATPEPSGEILKFNWNYIASFHKAGEMIGIGIPSLLPGGNGPAIIHFDCGHQVFGLVMPTRAPNMPTKVIPDWIAIPSKSEIAAPEAEDAA